MHKQRFFHPEKTFDVETLQQYSSRFVCLVLVATARPIKMTDTWWSYRL
jgi:hypothetical protein